MGLWAAGIQAPVIILCPGLSIWSLQNFVKTQGQPAASHVRVNTCIIQLGFWSLSPDDTSHSITEIYWLPRGRCWGHRSEHNSLRSLLSWSRYSRGAVAVKWNQEVKYMECSKMLSPRDKDREIGSVLEKGPRGASLRRWSWRKALKEVN